MKRLLGLLVTLALAVPASAHFIWLVPDKDKAAAVMVFSDSLEPDGNVPIAKIAQTQLFGRGADGKEFAVKATEAKDSYKVQADSAQPFEIAGVCRYGVFSKGKGEPYLLNYYAKTMITFGKEFPPPAWKGWSKLPLEIIPAKGKKMTAQVLWQGKPAAGIEVTMLPPGADKTSEAKTDADGFVTLTPTTVDGIYAARAKFVEAKEGELDGKKYKEVRHYSTITTHVKAKKAAP